MADQPISESKTPGILIVSSAVIIFPRKEVDGTFHLPGQEDLLAAVRDANEKGVKELLRGLDGNILVMIGATGEGVTYTDPPLAPVVIVTPPSVIEQAPTLSWPVATATSQQVINAISKAFGDFRLIPPDIFKDMTFKDEARKLNHRQMLYKDLKTARPLEEWKLSPDILEQLKNALRRYDPPLF